MPLKMPLNSKMAENDISSIMNKTFTSDIYRQTYVHMYTYVYTCLYVSSIPFLLVEG